MPNVRHIVGPPGTGKTETLAAEVGRLIEAGTDPGRMAVCTFTRAGAEEAGSRMAERFGLDPDRLPWWRTLHGIGLRFIRQDRGVDVAAGKHWREFCAAHSLATNPDTYRANPEEYEEEAEGDVLRSFHDWRRHNLLSLEVGYRMYITRFPDGLPVSMERIRWFEREWSAFKQDKSLVDYGDMLDEPERAGWSPEIDVLVVDEAQDLTPVQVSLVRRWSERADLILGYDDDQTIYPYMGANPTWLMDGRSPYKSLGQSHRVPKRIWDLANRLISRNRRRRPKTWSPRGEEGSVERDVPLDLLPRRIAGESGTWFVLTRNHYHLAHVTKMLNDAGIAYWNRSGWCPLRRLRDRPTLEYALRLVLREPIEASAVEALLRDRSLAHLWLPQAKMALRSMTNGAPDRLLDLMDLERLLAPEAADALRGAEGLLSVFGLEPWQARYYLDVLRREGKDGLLCPPRVEVGTIHSVKGAQADHVAVLPNMTRRTAHGYDEDPEPERRVWYVAVTRAREHLILLDRIGKGRYFDEL